MALYTILFGMSIFLIALVSAIIKKMFFHWKQEHKIERMMVPAYVEHPTVSIIIISEKCVIRRRTFADKLAVYDIISKSDMSLTKEEDASETQRLLPVDPPPETQQLPVDPAPKTQKLPVDPAPKTQKLPVDPAPKTQKLPVDPPPETQQLPVDPPPETQQLPVDPPPETQQLRVDPAPETPQLPVDPPPERHPSEPIPPAEKP